MLAEGQKKAAEEKLREAEQERVGAPGARSSSAVLAAAGNGLVWCFLGK